MTTNPDSAGILREEILAEARRQSEEIVSRARQEAKSILAAAIAEASRVREEEVDRARAEAVRRRELIQATVPVEAVWLRAARIETLLESIHEEARRRLLARNGFQYRETIVTLAALAISRMAGVAFVAKVPAADRSLLGDGICEEVMNRVGNPKLKVTLSFDLDTTGGGVTVEDAEAYQIWDNRLLKRLERMWPELRRQIALQASFVPKTESRGNNQ